jgi:hypothetical protein
MLNQQTGVMALAGTASMWSVARPNTSTANLRISFLEFIVSKLLSNGEKSNTPVRRRDGKQVILLLMNSHNGKESHLMKFHNGK